MRFVIFFVVICVFGLCAGLDCDSKETCDQCIQELNCFWCSTPTPNNTKSHCLPKTELNTCAEADTENPHHSLNIIKEERLTESQQISPQRIQLKLRKNEKYEISFRYRQSANYPVDLYYIMDLSHSMEESKHKLAELGGKLVQEMKRKTNNFQIGFGSFVDKLALPYVNTHPDALKSPCAGCASPYSFKNHLSLMNDAGLFSRKVQETRMSGNLDTPEGGLDAIMQAIVCKKEIGWRPNARHLLVMSTDAVSHIAGDGKLGGVIEPNDAKCHMKNNSYTHGLIYDYPSVSQINYVARENNINLIFAIVLKESDPNHLKQHYDAMSTVIENSKTGTLEKKSDNVVKFISDIYDQIRDSVRITSDAKRDVSVNITSGCPGSVDGSCTNVTPGQTIQFNAVIEPLICFKDGKSNKKTIKIKPEGLEDSLTIDLEVICDCECASQKQTSDKECSYKGDLECGTCRCNEGRFGAKCQCDRSDSKGEDPMLCVKPGGKNQICSGHGKCICGKCECISKPEQDIFIYGKYCECDNSSCPLKCSGRGNCDCGKCSCDKGWGGPGCECSTDQSQCMPSDPDPAKRILCSGQGECICGKCECKNGENQKYSGKYCEESDSRPSEKCADLKPCVECQVYKNGPFANPAICTANCTNFQTKTVSKLKEGTREGVRKCREEVENDCVINFEYSYDDDRNLIVTAEEQTTCPPSLWIIVAGVIGSVILIGIITLIVWKVLTTMHDKKEYARFMKESHNTQWSRNENPLYKPGTSHFKNPAYGRASQRISVTAKKSPTEVKEQKVTES